MTQFARKTAVALALALSVAASGAFAKDRPAPRMKAETIAAYSTQNKPQEWVPVAIMMLILLALLSGGSQLIYE